MNETNYTVSVAHPDLAHMTKFDEYLYVTSVGAISKCRYITKTSRPKGRDDYHILYVAKGEMTLKIDSVTHTLSAGCAAFIDYGIPHEYIVQRQDNFMYYWIHFKGNLAKELLSDLGLSKSLITSPKNKKELCNLLEQLIKETGTKRKNYFKSCQQILTEILIHISAEAEGSDGTTHFSQIERVASMMRNDNCIDMTVEDFAKICGLSSSRFTKKFSQATGMTPIEYRNRAIADKAIWHLKNTNLTVTEISDILGFVNPSYFSTMFKKHTGVTPSEYKSRYSKESQ